MSAGLYIHIPFCKSICYYCDFFRGVYDAKRAGEYPAALERDAREFSQEGIRFFDSVYVGGGTPTVLPKGALKAALTGIKRYFVIQEGAEFSCEGNPESFTREKALELKSLGVNRISLGVQSLSDKSLKALGRIHSASEALSAVRLAAGEGMRVSADIMLGVPFQGEEDLKEFVARMREAGAEHLSAYMLTLCPGTPLWQAEKRGEFILDDDRIADLYEVFHAAAREAGYERYEVSNWALDGAESRHNLKYWRGEEYVGLGAGAYSMVKGRRFYTEKDIDKYLSGNIVRVTEEVMTQEELEKERVVFGLRTRFGAPEEALKGAGIDVKKLMERAGRFFEQRGGALHLKEEFFLVADGIVAKYII